MIGITELEPTSVFKYFEEISKIPHGSGNMERISRYCMDFAEKHSLKAICDESYNVVIYKPGTKGYENSAPVILQGHLDMVCQKTENCSIDFETDGLDIYVDGDYIKANGTTLGADNGIAVAMILSILESDNIPHPPIEAVFTTDEEIGMVGALALRSEVISASKMINIDSEDASVITVSCAGGSDFCAEIPIVRKLKSGTTVTLCVKGLSGGHSGVEINSGRVNSNILIARILNHINQKFDFDIMCINGGDKGNAIPLCSTAKILCDDSDALISEFVDYCKTVKEEISAREPGFAYEYCVGETKEQSVISTPDTKKLIYHLLCSPNGVVEMSAEINGLVETSLNMGILETHEDIIRILYALRSNKQSALSFLEEKLTLFFSGIQCRVIKGGHYPPWEYNPDSVLRELYSKSYAKKFGKNPSVEAIHAGLECGVFAEGRENFDCISIGPEMHGIHTVNEKLSITSTRQIYEILLDVLSNLK